MSKFSDRFVEYYIGGKSDSEVMRSLEKDSFNLVCALADDVIEEKLPALPIEYRDRIMNIALIFRAVIKREKEARRE